MATAKTKSSRLHTPEGIACFTQVFVPKARTDKAGNPKGDPKYSLVLCFDEDADLADLKAEAKRVGIERFGPEFVAGVRKGKYNWPFRDNEDYADNGFPFTQDGTFISFKSTDRPGIVDENADPIMDKSEFYSGVKCRVSCKAFAYDNESKGVAFGLVNIQKLDDGERLAGNPDASDDFGATKSKSKAKGKSKADDNDDDDLL
jgi:Protein of unknown function (DUF2815)